ncbi:MAG TPA: DNA topoisomerase 3 [Ktedonobacteraceae bacterium]|jgi:DNA topoisomerase-3
MRLFIAEKPELARAIVEGLGGGRRKEGYYDCGNDCVTWCFGHMLQLLDPEDYDERYATWRMDDLPIAHIPWRKKPAAGKSAQLRIVTHLLKQADSVVHAGDPDEEGQLLVDEILAYAHCRLPVKRLLINDNNTRVVRKALANLRDNREFAALSASAEARSVGDQLYGYNLTRAYTLAARAVGYQGVLSVGRVQTPILGLVVRRDREFESHVTSFYYHVTGQFQVQRLTFPARYQTAPGDPVDDKGRLIDQKYAQAIADAVKGKDARVVSADTQQKEQLAPLPYNLLHLQTDAARKFGFKPDQVKDITQSLREKHRLITYNRSDCEYLSDEQHADAPGVLAAIAQTAPMLAPASVAAIPMFKSRAFNSSKVTAHHAIIPTENTADLATLSTGERKIYILIARAYVAQFWPTHRYDQTDVLVEIAGRRFACRSQVTTRPGWLALYKSDMGNDRAQNDEHDLTLALDIRGLRTGQRGICTDATADQLETRPRPRYTTATLLTDLTRVAKYIRDDRLRKVLQEKDKNKEGEHGGIGTPATRDRILATLFERGYLAEQGKSIVSTLTGRQFYDTLPDQAKYPDMTALWHEQQKAIQAGERDAASFIRELMEYITGEVSAVKENDIGIAVEAPQCPECQKPLRRIKGKKGFFWGCTGLSEGCAFHCPDKGGKPAPKRTLKVSAHTCLVCGKGLVRRPGKKKGTFWWGCSGFPACKQTYPDAKGKPDYNTRQEPRPVSSRS